MNSILPNLAFILSMLVCSCDKNSTTTIEPAVEPSDRQFSISSPFMSNEEYSSFAAKAGSGDHEAAFQLYNNFTYGARNYGLAYFWATKARSLGSTKITQKEIDLAEKNIFSEASSFDPKASDGEDVESDDLLK